MEKKASVLTKISTEGMSREDWLKARRDGIGGSDAAAIVGMNDYASPWSVWADKKGLVPEKPDSEAMRIGRDLEEYVAKRFTEASGYKVQRSNYMYKNAKYPWAIANIDRKLVTAGKSGLECKTTSAWNVKHYKGGSFPDRFYCQCVHYMAVMEMTRWYLAVLVLGEGLHIYQMTTIKHDVTPEWCEGSVYVDRHEIDALMDAEKAFWEDHVLTGISPQADGEKATSAAVAAVVGNGEHDGEISMRCDAAIRNYIELGKQVKLLEKEQEKWKQEILISMSGYQRGTCGSYRVSNQPTTRSTFQHGLFQHDFPQFDYSGYYKTTTSTRFTIKEVK